MIQYSGFSVHTEGILSGKVSGKRQSSDTEVEKLIQNT
tara:strand:- start:570 stop:683 length:114 start_codon:yes stop_codon:yes gene_type:complete